MFKLGLEKAEEPEVKLPTSTGSWKKQGNSRKSSTSASLTMLKPLTMWITTNCGKFWKRWEYQTTWPASWETCKPVKKTVRTGHGTTDCLKIGKGVRQGCILLPCLFNWYAESVQFSHSVVSNSLQPHEPQHASPSCPSPTPGEYIMRNARLDEAQAGIKIAGRNINNLRYADDTTLMAKRRRTKEPLDEGEKREWKSWLKAQHSEN